MTETTAPLPPPPSPEEQVQTLLTAHLDRCGLTVDRVVVERVGNHHRITARMRDCVQSKQAFLLIESSVHIMVRDIIRNVKPMLFVDMPAELFPDTTVTPRCRRPMLWELIHKASPSMVMYTGRQYASFVDLMARRYPFKYGEALRCMQPHLIFPLFVDVLVPSVRSALSEEEYLVLRSILIHELGRPPTCDLELFEVTFDLVIRKPFHPVLKKAFDVAFWPV